MLSEVLRRDTLSQAGRARVAKKNTQSDAFWSLFGDAVFAVLVLSSVAWGLASIAVWKSNLRRIRPESPRYNLHANDATLGSRTQLTG